MATTSSSESESDTYSFDRRSILDIFIAFKLYGGVESTDLIPYTITKTDRPSISILFNTLCPAYSRN